MNSLHHKLFFDKVINRIGDEAVRVVRLSKNQQLGTKASVRPAVLEDYPGFAHVAQEVHQHHVKAIPDVFQSVDLTVSEDHFARWVTGEDSDVYVAVDNGEIVGYAVLLHSSTSRDMHVSRTFSFIDNFGVLEKSRRTGVGSMLFAACVDKAKEKGVQTLELDCWEANEQAVLFYEAMGMNLKRRWYSMAL